MIIHTVHIVLPRHRDTSAVGRQRRRREDDMIRPWGSPAIGLPPVNHAQSRLGWKYAVVRCGGDRAHPRRSRQDHRRTRLGDADRGRGAGTGVTRQTVYRYFPGKQALLVASAMRSADGFLDRMAAQLQGVTDPVVAITEGMAFAIEELVSDNQVAVVLNQRHRGGQKVSIVFDTALAFGRSMLHRYDIDWEHYGFDEAGLDELNEFSLRVLHSYLADPGRPPRRGGDLRRYLTRWIGPAIAYPHMVRAMDALDARGPSRPHRRTSRSKAS
jgi:AcrR family transcriptional regulator